MARTAITHNYNLRDGGLTVTPTAVDVANGHKIDAGVDGKIAIVVQNTFAGAKTVTVKAGNRSHGGQGDLVVTVPTSGWSIIGPLQSSRFKQADGCYYLDYQAGMTGNIIPFHLP